MRGDVDRVVSLGVLSVLSCVFVDGLSPIQRVDDWCCSGDRAFDQCIEQGAVGHAHGDAAPPAEYGGKVVGL